MPKYVDWVPLKEVDGFKLNDVFIVRDNPWSISSFPSDQHVVLTQVGDYNPNEPMELELTMVNLKEAIAAGRVQRKGRLEILGDDQ
jgi:hypothetical protein